MESKFRFALTEGGRLLAAEGHWPVAEFKDGAWVPFRGVLGVWMDAKPVTASYAMRLTSGVMPA